MTRRDALAWLGALGWAGCRARKASPPLRGSIVGGAHARGHRVRDGFRPAAARRERTGVAILGAGVAGLSAAWALERAGFRDFLVLELEDEPGGTARAGGNAVSRYPWGAHYVPVPSPDNRPLVALLEEVGAVAGRDGRGRPRYAEDALCHDPQERVFFRGEWYEGLYPRLAATAGDLAQLESFEREMARWAAWRDPRGRRGFAAPRARSSDAPEMRALDGLSMEAYLRRGGWDSPRLRWFVEYGCRDDFGATLAQTSAWAGVHYFAARMEAPGEEPAEFLTWPEGNGRLVRHLAETAGRRLRLGTLVTEVAPRRDGVDVTCYDDQAREAVAVAADHVVFALPRFLAARLIKPWRESPPAFLAESVYAPWAVANLTLRERPQSRGFPLAWDNVLYDSPSLGYVVATHQAGRDDGPTVLTWYHADLSDDVRGARQRLLESTWEAWAARILADLEPAHPDLRELVEQIDVYLWGHAMVRPLRGFCWSEALRAAAQPLGRVHFAHTDLSGMALFEEAQYWGVHAAEAVLKALGQRFTTWLD